MLCDWKGKWMALNGKLNTQRILTTTDLSDSCSLQMRWTRSTFPRCGTGLWIFWEKMLTEASFLSKKLAWKGNYIAPSIIIFPCIEGNGVHVAYKACSNLKANMLRGKSQTAGRLTRILPIPNQPVLPTKLCYIFIFIFIWSPPTWLYDPFKFTTVLLKEIK